MTFYAIRHIRTGELMPQVLTRGGYSHWNPDNPNMPHNIFDGTPRLHMTRRKAKRCIVQWFVCQNGRRGWYQSYEGDVFDEIKVKEDGRKKEDLEVVEVELEVKR